MKGFRSVQSLSHVRLFVTPWTAARQASLSITNSQSLLKLMFIELVMPSNHLILCRPLLLPPLIFPSIRVFSNELTLCISGQSIGVSASASVLPMNIQDWSPLGWTGWISLQSKSSPAPPFKSTNSSGFSFLHSPALTLQVQIFFPNPHCPIYTGSWMESVVNWIWCLSGSWRVSFIF